MLDKIKIASLFVLLTSIGPAHANGDNQPTTNGFLLSHSLWAGSSIDVCWENMSDITAAERNEVQFAVRTSWERQSKVRFNGWGQCTASSRGIRILADDVGPHVKALGRYLDGRVNGMVLNFDYENWSTSCQYRKSFCNKAIAVHEFGHALGFAHEQNRPDTPETCHQSPQGTNGDIMIGDWDQFSVMNYCNPTWNNAGVLSSTDRLTLALFYGDPDRFVPSQWAGQLGGYPIGSKFIVGDYNGDGNDDIAKVFNDQGLASIAIYRSNGVGGFTSFRRATQVGGFSTNQNWLAADVDGDGKDELANVFYDSGKASVTIHTMNGPPHTHTRWATQQGAFNAEQKWFAGDFNGDGKDDLANVYSDQGKSSIDVHTNVGATFVLENWVSQSGGFWPGQVWLAADYNGDGVDDITRLFDHGLGFNKITTDVFVSNKSKFNVQRWAFKEGYSTFNQQWLAEDFTGNGQADVLSLDSRTTGDLFEAEGHDFDYEFQESAFQGVITSDMVLVSGDFNGDSRGDFAKITRQLGSVTINVHKGICRPLFENCQ